MVGVFIFTILVAGVLGAISALTRSVKAAREKTELASLVSADLEVVRNLPYVQVGTVNGNPSGSLPDASNPRTVTIEGRAYRIYYEVTYFDDPADGTAVLGTDPSAADYKQVKMFVESTVTSTRTTIVTNIAPKGLEGTQNAGALLLKVFNAVGTPVPNASIHITNTAITPNIQPTCLTANCPPTVPASPPSAATAPTPSCSPTWSAATRSRVLCRVFRHPTA